MNPHLRKLLANVQSMPRQILLWGYHQLYDKWAGVYDAVAGTVSLGRWYRWVALVVPSVCGPRVLELGPGTGHLLQLLLEASGIHPIGADISYRMLLLAQGRTQRRVPLVRCAARCLPIAPLSFDSIVSTFPAEFIRDRLALREFHRALRPGGRLIILPAAQMIGEGALDKLAAWALAAIGHAPRNTRAALEGALMPLFEQAAFDAVLQEVRSADSRVFMIVATKAVVGP